MLPLKGIRVLAVEHYAAGPYGTQQLANLGADVIKIETRATGGDAIRYMGSDGGLGDQDSLSFQVFNRNKRSLALDLKDQEGREILGKLVATADAFLCNLRGDQPEKLGLTYDSLKQYNPKIVCALVSAYGREGPRRHWPGFDYLMQAEAGYLYLSGEPGGDPARMGLSLVDHLTALTAALGLVSSVIGARETGKGRDIDVTLFDTAAHQLSYIASWYLNDGLEISRAHRSAHPSIAPSQLFKTADSWIFVMAQTDRFWELLCEKIGLAEIIGRTEFRDVEARFENRELLAEILEARLMTEPTTHWMNQLGGFVPCGPVYDLAGALENPFLHDRGGVITVTHPHQPDLRVVESPIRLDEPTPNRPAPALGADTGDILRELGYDDEAIQLLRDRQIT